MYAGPHRCRFAFFLDVVAAISDERPGMAVAHHVGPKVAAIGAANRDGSAVAIESPARLAVWFPPVRTSRRGDGPLSSCASRYALDTFTEDQP
jgi:hypothetical protein